MTLRVVAAVSLISAASACAALAQSGNAGSGDAYMPRLGEIMAVTQARHIKLGLAGNAANWDLAAYELGELKAGLEAAAMLYRGLPVSGVTTMAGPIEALQAAAKAKDGRAFWRAYGELTRDCNACHQSLGRGFIVVKAPDSSPFSDQSFAPAKP